MYNFFQTIHVLAAVVWVGSGFFFNLLMGRLSMGGEIGAVQAITKQTKFVSQFFNITAITTLVFGIAMVLEAEFLEFSDPFISIGFLGVIASLGIGHGMIAPAATKLGEAIESGDAAAAEALGKRVGMLSTVDTIILFVVVWAMVVKPF